MYRHNKMILTTVQLQGEGQMRKVKHDDNSNLRFEYS